ncbi:MAG: autotransporter outer membrane beta-barrel domain-containing protein [Magnetococcus sp. DMHC-6]
MLTKNEIAICLVLLGTPILTSNVAFGVEPCPGCDFIDTPVNPPNELTPIEIIQIQQLEQQQQQQQETAAEPKSTTNAAALNSASLLQQVLYRNTKTNIAKSTTGRNLLMIRQQVANTFFKKRKTSKGAFLNTQPSGIAAGEEVSPITTWANYNFVKSEDQSVNDDIKMHTFLVGADNKIKENIALGMTASYQGIQEDFVKSDSTTDVLSLSPYAAYQLNENLVLDTVVGYAWLNESPSSAESFDTSRFIFATHLTAMSTTADKLTMSGYIGYMFTKDNIDAHVTDKKISEKQNDVSFAQVSLGVESAYQFTDVTEGYLTLSIEDDLVYEGSDTYDATGFTTGIGGRMLLNDVLNADLNVSNVFARQDYKESTVMLNLRYEF